MKQTLRDRILSFFRKNPTWINGGEIERLAMSAGYKGSTASRECRELEREGYLQKEMRKGKRVSSVWYKINKIDFGTDDESNNPSNPTFGI